MSNMQMPESNTGAASQTTPAVQYIKVGMSTCGIAAGAEEVFNTLLAELRKHNLAVKVSKCGCIGRCYAEPLVEVKVDGLPSVLYGRVNKTVAQDIVEKHIVAKQLVKGYIFDND